MTSADTEAMQALHDLLAERQRYEGWMQALDERRASTPSHVYNRVHSDYVLRLERVIQRLSERTEQLKATVESVTARLASLRAKETERTDARHEGELRAAVGEYGEADWEKMREDSDRELEAIGAERTSVETELADLQRLMALTTAPAVTIPAAEPEQGNSGAATPEQEAAAASDATASDATASASSAADGAATGGSHAQDEETPSIDNFVADWPVRHLEQTGAAATPQSDGVPRVPEVDHTRATTPAQSAPQAAYQAAPPARENAPAEPAQETRREQEKTLKCPECGTMNYATEWYCERCGGELATF